MIAKEIIERLRELGENMEVLFCTGDETLECAKREHIQLSDDRADAIKQYNSIVIFLT